MVEDEEETGSRSGNQSSAVADDRSAVLDGSVDEAGVEGDGDDPDGLPSTPGSGWPVGVRDVLNLEDIHGGFNPHSWTRVLLAMDGKRGRNDSEAHDAAKALGPDKDPRNQKKTTLKGRPRNAHIALERTGLIKPGGEVTRLSHLGRTLRDLSGEHGLRRYVAREALSFLLRYQSDNPVDGDKWPDGCRVHPYWIVLRAARDLDYRIHWDEVNRELMRILDDGEVSEVVAKIGRARDLPGYGEFLGSGDNGPGFLQARVHAAAANAPPRRTPEGQLRDQRFTPFLKLAGFGELLLASPGSGGQGFWSVPESVRDIVAEAVREVPPHFEIRDRDEWIEWLYEGRVGRDNVAVATAVDTAPTEIRPAVIPVRDLTVGKVKKALARHAPHLRYKDSLLAAVVASVRAGDGKNFIILRGVSGTGKTQLVSALASAVFDVPRPEYPLFQQIEVRPDWTDVTHVLGYEDPVKGKYVTPRFMKAVEAAYAEFRRNGEHAAPVFVCLDEMNLAPVELYLADCLSLMESGRAMDHGIRGDDDAVTEIRWPPNLFLFGTVNVDETTAEISDKVLDRAQVIDTSDIEIGGSLTKWLADAENLSGDDRELVHRTLSDVWAALREIERHFGFRTAKAMVRFVDEAVASSDGVLDAGAALDAQIVQKVLVKLRGEGEHWSKTLEAIRSAVAGLPVPVRSLKIVERMKSDHARLGSFQFWE